MGSRRMRRKRVEIGQILLSCPTQRMEAKS